MPFKKFNAKGIVQEKILKDKEFENAYSEIKAEYVLIKEVVQRRKDLGLTQETLANKTGMKQQVVSRFENEKHIPNLSSFIKILNALDLELSIKKKTEYINV